MWPGSRDMRKGERGGKPGKTSRKTKRALSLGTGLVVVRDVRVCRADAYLRALSLGQSHVVRQPFE